MEGGCYCSFFIFLFFFMSQEIENVLKNIQAQPGVIGYVVMTGNGLPVKTSLSDSETLQYCGLVSDYVTKSQASVGGKLLTKPVDVIRIRSKKNELIITPEKDFILLVIQDVSVAE